MKKLLLLLITLLFVFTLSACTEDVPTLEEFGVLETTVADNDLSIAALETELAALEDSLAALEGGADVEELIADIESDISAINVALHTLGYFTDVDIAEVNALVAAMQVKIDELVAITDLLVSPIPVIIVPNFHIKVPSFGIETLNEPLWLNNKAAFATTTGKSKICSKVAIEVILWYLFFESISNILL